MKITAWDMMTDQTIKLTASFTTDHPLSSYGQPVMLIKEWEDNDVMSHQNWLLAGCKVTDLPEKDKKAFEKWYSLITAMTGNNK